MKFRYPKRFTSMALILIGLSACSSKPQPKEFDESANADQELRNFKVAIDNAAMKNVELLAPENFEEVRDSLSDAEELKKDKASNDAILEEIGEGRAYLQRAEKIAQENEDSLRDVVVARNEAVKARANVLFPDRFNDIDGDVREETRKLEADEYSNLKEEKPRMITDYKNLELDAIKKTYIGESQKVLRNAESNGARDVTPKTYQEAYKAVNAAELYITKNRYDKEGISQRAEVASEKTDKLKSTFGTARNIEKTSLEETALRLQKEKDQLNQTQSALKRESSAAAALAADNAELTQEQELQKNYEMAVSKFSPSEAEVYKQGQNLIIRLRGLEFPTNEAVVRGENFALLKKVDDVIESFDKSTVAVEGHTDSTGGAELNKRLSDERAQAVRQYLEANTAEGSAEFESRGYGYEKPLASNKSPQGRAQNRRVDVIITPKEI